MEVVITGVIDVNCSVLEIKVGNNDTKDDDGDNDDGGDDDDDNCEVDSIADVRVLVALEVDEVELTVVEENSGEL